MPHHSCRINSGALTVPWLVALVLLFPNMALGGSLWGRSDTYVGASGVRPVFGAHDSRSQAPLYQLVQLRSADLGLQHLGLEVAGFAAVELGQRRLLDPLTEDHRLRGNLTVGRLCWSSDEGSVSLCAGRQYLFGYGGRTQQLDGLALTYRGPWHLELDAFGGRSTPWQVDYDPTQGEPDAANESWFYSNYTVGGRLRWRLLERAVALAGFVYEWNGEETVTQAANASLGYYGSRWLEVHASGVFDTVARAPQELSAQLISRPARRLKLTADYAYEVPSLLIPKTSIFSVFTTEAYHDAALTAYIGLLQRLTVGLEGGLRLYPGEASATLGYTAAGVLRLALDEIAGRLVGLRMELSDSSREQLLQGRLFALYRFGSGVYTSADLYLIHLSTDGTGPTVFTRRFDERSLSLGGMGLVGYRLPWGLDLQLSGGGYSTPLARRDLRLLARVSYAGDWQVGR